jgi:hypothetical protein
MTCWVLFSITHGQWLRITLLEFSDITLSAIDSIELSYEQSDSVFEMEKNQLDKQELCFCHYQLPTN